MSPSSLTATALPWLVVAWIVTIVVVAALIYLIMRAVLSRTEPQRLPEVLRALTPLLRGVTQALTRPSAGSLTEGKPPPDALTEQTGDTPAMPTEEAS
jgi:hypothetical protein